MTSSPFLIFSIVPGINRCRRSQYFGRERNDLHEALAAELPGHGPEDARADRLQFGRKKHRRVRVEPDAAAVRATHAEGRTHHNGRSEEHTSELQSQSNLVCRLLLEKKNYT